MTPRGSIVQARGDPRYLGVRSTTGARAECGCVEKGERRSVSFPQEVLQLVPALGSDEAQWLEAFRAAMWDDM